MVVAMGQRGGHRAMGLSLVQCPVQLHVSHSALVSDNVNATKYICTQYCCVFGLR